MEKNIHDFKKAVEQKQKRDEAKEKHAPVAKLLEQDVKKILNQSEILKNFGDEFLGEYKGLADKYNDLATKYEETVNTVAEVVDILDKVSNSNDRYSYFSSLAEHFIVKSNLEQEFIQFIKDVAETESVKEYREAAQWKDGFYRMEIDDYGMHMMIDDEYGWMKEEEMEGIY